MVEPGNRELSVTRQCELLGLPRSSYYYKASGLSERDLRQMRMIDEEYTRHPFRGSRGMRDYLEDQGEPACRDRVRRLMRHLGLQAIYPKKRLSFGNREHKKYPYLLRHIEIARPDHVWCSDITYIRLKGGFVYLVVATAIALSKPLQNFFHRLLHRWEILVGVSAEDHFDFNVRLAVLDGGTADDDSSVDVILVLAHQPNKLGGTAGFVRCLLRCRNQTSLLQALAHLPHLSASSDWIGTF